MKALILAAGRGRRMKGLTEDRPKALLKVSGKPLLKHAIENLRAASISDLGIVTGYQAESLAWPEFTSTFHNPEWATTQMVSSLFRAQSWLSEDETIVCYSDILFTPATISKLMAAPGEIVVANNVNWHSVWSKRFADPLVDAETFKRDAHGVLTEIGKKPLALSDVQGQFMGLLKISPNGWRAFEGFREAIPPEEFAKIDMTSTLNRLISRGVKIRTVDVNESWYEFDSEEDLKSYE